MADVIWFGASETALTAVRAPAVMTVVNQDYDSSSTARTASGKIVRTVVRGGDNNVRKLQLEWSLLDWAEGAAILNAVKSTYIYCRYPDPQTGALRTMKCYVGDRTSKLRRYDNGNARWTSIAFNLTEV